MKLFRLTTLLAFLQSTFPGVAQDNLRVNEIPSLPGKYYNKLNQKINALEGQLDKKTEAYLKKIERQETKLFKKLWQKDSSVAKELSGNIKDQYSSLQTKAAQQAKQLNKFSQVYSGKLDSLGTAFSFLETNGLVSPELKDKITSSTNAISGLQDKLNQTDIIRKYLKERKQLLTAQLEKFGLTKQLKQFNKQVFYYQQQVKEYKELLDNPDKLTEKILGLVAELPAFKDFFANNSQLGSLFNLPGSLNNNPASLAGLQTRASVMQDLQNRFGSGPSVQQMLQQNMQSAQGQLNELKNKVNQYLPQGGSSDDEIPDFKPNNQKTKSFWQRLEYGTNFQSQKPNGYFPVTSDIGLSLGYKLNEKSVIGIGASYKIGWGQSIRHIDITSQGAGLRSFVDWKIKGSFWLSGGYEMNYFSEFNRIRDLIPSPSGGGQAGASWQQSGLVGLSKVVSMNSKFFKKTKLQLLWDFLSYRQMPRTQPVVFRVGYNIK